MNNIQNEASTFSFLNPFKTACKSSSIKGLPIY
jgi:hypothetical protein